MWDRKRGTCRYPNEGQELLLFWIVQQIGGMTVEELKERITAHEVAMWDRLRALEASPPAGLR